MNAIRIFILSILGEKGLDTTEFNGLKYEDLTGSGKVKGSSNAKGSSGKDKGKGEGEEKDKGKSKNKKSKKAQDPRLTAPKQDKKTEGAGYKNPIPEEVKGNSHYAFPDGVVVDKQFPTRQSNKEQEAQPADSDGKQEVQSVLAAATSNESKNNELFVGLILEPVIEASKPTTEDNATIEGDASSEEDISFEGPVGEIPEFEVIEQTEAIDSSEENGKPKFLPYRFVAGGPVMLAYLMWAFAVHNDIDVESVIWLTDGAGNLTDSIRLRFGQNAVIILDYYHLKKKVHELLTSLIKTTDEHKLRIDIETAIMDYLWKGNPQAAIDYINKLDEFLFKPGTSRKALVTYLTNKMPLIPNYGARRAKGLMISSNPVENCNNLLVSQRQKNNGTSWTAPGSLAMALITCLYLNGELFSFLKTRKIGFKFMDKKPAKPKKQAGRPKKKKVA
jgi:hypothetical protein